MISVEEKDADRLKKIAQSIGVKVSQVTNVINLLKDDNTIPFISRYRKEMTGGLDEVQINDIHDEWQYAVNLDQRQQEVIRLIDEQGKLTDELRSNIERSGKLQEVEDLYRPYKQKRRTKATVAKEKGLEPFAEWLLSKPNSSVETEARKYLSEEKEVVSVEDAISGAQDIIAETISDDPKTRQWIRHSTFQDGLLKTTVKNEEADEKKVFEMYYAYDEKIKSIVPHRVLAINRGEKDGILKVSVVPQTEIITTKLERQTLGHGYSTADDYLKEAAADAYKRLIAPSIEREIRQLLTEKADKQAIHIFSENLKHLLLQPPMKERIVLGVDPAFRTGCKLSVIDETGKVLDIAVIYPTPPKSETEKSKRQVISLIEKHQIEMVAIGNGTASRETEQFIADVLKEVDKDIAYIIVNEAGASVYSASPLAREEFPDLRVEERSAVSIARRLQDPLAELVKIDPKSVGVGQYQHDVSQKDLNGSLTFVVETVVNRVGVNVNTASVSLLQYVSGLSKTVAQNIVNKRNEQGKFLSRKDLKGIPRLGNKSFQQSAGFLRITEGDQPLDQTPIHPENYNEALALLKTLDCRPEDIGSEKLAENIKTVDIKGAAERLDIGEPTLKDIIDALVRPGRDPRDEIAKPLLKTEILTLEDLQKGMQLEGTVRNVVDFGAFVDIGVKQDGLVHISKLVNRFVKHPLDVVHVGQIVTIWVEGVDAQKGRVSLTMIEPGK